MATFHQLQAVKRRHSSRLLRCAGVCGLDISTDAGGEPVLTLHLESDDPQLRKQLPEQLEGHPLRLVVTGPIRKQAAK